MKKRQYQHILDKKINRSPSTAKYKCADCNTCFRKQGHLAIHRRYRHPLKVLRHENSTNVHFDRYLPTLQNCFEEQIEFAEDMYGKYISSDVHNELLSLQRELIKRSTPHSISPFVVNKVVNVLAGNKKETSDWIDYLDIYSLVSECSLSTKDTDNLIQTICRIAIRRDQQIVLPKSSKVIKKAVQSVVLSLFKYTKYRYLLPLGIFSLEYERQQAVAAGHYVDVMQVIAEMLIDIPVENFHFEHFKLRTEEGDRMFREPATGHVFKEYCEVINKRFGPDVYPLTIIVNGDSLVLNKTGIVIFYCDVNVFLMLS